MTVHTSPTGFKRGGDVNSDLKDDQSGEDDSSACSVSESSTSGKDRFFKYLRVRGVHKASKYVYVRPSELIWV